MHVASADLDTNTSGRFLLEPSAADPTQSSCIHPDSRLPYKMLASRPQLPCQRTFSPRSISISIRPLPPVQSLRRDLLAGLAGVSLLLAQDASALDLSNLNSSSAATASDTGSFISITPINKKAKDFMDMRDDAMEYQCKGKYASLMLPTFRLRTRSRVWPVSC